MDVEITVALIGAGVTIISPFIALFIKNYCEKDPNKNDSNKKKPDKKVDEEKKPITNVKKLIVKNNEKETNQNDIESQEEIPKNYCQIIETQGSSIRTLCNCSNLQICRFCGMTFCQHHLYVNNNTVSLGGHICRDHR